MLQTKKFKKLALKFTITDCSNFDKRFSGAHFVSVFLILLLLYSKFQFRIICCFEPIKMKTLDRYHLILTYLMGPWASVRPKPLFWFRSDTETETQIGQ